MGDKRERQVLLKLSQMLIARQGAGNRFFNRKNNASGDGLGATSQPPNKLTCVLKGFLPWSKTLVHTINNGVSFVNTHFSMFHLI